jgi:hypothetical protein
MFFVCSSTPSSPSLSRAASCANWSTFFKRWNASFQLLHLAGILKVLLLRCYQLILQLSDLEVCRPLQFAMFLSRWRNFLSEPWLP